MPSSPTYGRAVEEAERRKLNSSREWRDGAVRAMHDYVDAAADAASAAEEATTLAFRSMEDALVTFATAGKFEFSSLADSILADITRIAVRQAITAPLAGFLSGNADDFLVASARPSPGCSIPAASSESIRCRRGRSIRCCSCPPRASTPAVSPA